MLSVAIYIKDVQTGLYNRVDLFDDEKISVVSSIQNINDISKTFTDFSQTFTVPASKQNNKIFRHWYDNSNDEPFSTLVKADAYIEIDTITFRRGKIQLESANVEDGQAKDYSITFIGLLGNLKDTFAGLYLKDLTSTTYDFNYTPNDVISRVVDTIPSQDVMFPLITSDRGWQYSPTFNDYALNWPASPIRYNELFPALRLRAVLNMIEERFEINFDGTTQEPSTFLTDPRFTNAYLWLKNADDFKYTSSDTLITYETKTEFNTPLSTTFFFIVNLDNESFSLIKQTNSRPDYAYFVRIYITPTAPSISYSVILFKNNEEVSRQSATSIVGEQGFIFINNLAGNLVVTSDVYTWKITSEQTMTFNSYCRLTNENFNYSSPLRSAVNLNKTSNQTISVSELSIRKYFPEIKIEDFFSGLLKMFNLTCFSNDGINYTVETIDNYYDAGSDVDITKYVIQDKKTLNRVKTHKKINFDYEKSESFMNVAFESNAGIEYGSLHYSNTPPAEGEEYSIKLPFEDLNFSNLFGSFQVGYALKTDLQKYIPKPVILYDYNPSGTTNAGFTFYTSEALTGDGEARTLYKAFGQETLIGTETYGLNFNEQQSTLTNEIVNNGLYQTYYSNYFANIFDFKARLTKLSAILPTSILTTLKLNDTILIRDTKYLINTMTTDLTSGVAQFELLTDQRIVEPLSIVTDGLVLNLDAGNPLSYPGTGTTWTDLTTNGNNGTLINGPTFDSGNGGSIVFDGTNDYVSSFPIQISGNGSKTVSCFFKINTTIRSGLCGTRNFDTSPNGWVLCVNRTTSGNLSYYHTSGSILEIAAGISTNTWYNACVTYDVSTAIATLYLNGIIIGSPATSFTTINSSSFNGVIGAETVNGGFLNGNIAQTLIYNRALSSQEVLQNYNATKGRYGL